MPDDPRDMRVSLHQCAYRAEYGGELLPDSEATFYAPLPKSSPALKALTLALMKGDFIAQGNLGQIVLPVRPWDEDVSSQYKQNIQNRLRADQLDPLKERWASNDATPISCNFWTPEGAIWEYDQLMVWSSTTPSLEEVRQNQWHSHSFAERGGETFSCFSMVTLSASEFSTWSAGTIEQTLPKRTDWAGVTAVIATMISEKPQKGAWGTRPEFAAEILKRAPKAVKGIAGQDNHDRIQAFTESLRKHVEHNRAAEPYGTIHGMFSK